MGIWIQNFTAESRKMLGRDLVGINLVGSGARGDIVQGFSDLDFIFILRSEEVACRRILQSIHELKRRFELEHGVRYAVNCFTESDLFSHSRYPRINPLALHEFLSSNKLLYGRSLEGAALPSFEDPAVRRFVAEDILRARDILREWTLGLRADDKLLKLATRQSIWCSFRAAKAYLAVERKLPAGKEAILKCFEESCVSSKLKESLRQTHETRIEWHQLRRNKELLVNRFYASLAFIDGLAHEIKLCDRAGSTPDCS